MLLSHEMVYVLQYMTCTNVATTCSFKFNIVRSEVDMVRLLVGTVRKKIVGMPRLDVDMAHLVLHVALQMFANKACLFADMVR